jgi:hypothetical protein
MSMGVKVCGMTVSTDTAAIISTGAAVRHRRDPIRIMGVCCWLIKQETVPGCCCCYTMTGGTAIMDLVIAGCYRGTGSGTTAGCTGMTGSTAVRW